MLSEGKHKVKIKATFTGESEEKKTAYYGIEFETLEEKKESIFWLAYLTETPFIKDGKETNLAVENTKKLVEMGFKGKTFADLSDESKSVSDLFNETEITIIVEHEEYADKKSGELKTAAKVKWVNTGSSGPARHTHKEAIVKMKSLNLDGEILRLQKLMGTKKEKNVETTTVETPYNTDDIPF